METPNKNATFESEDAKTPSPNKYNLSFEFNIDLKNMSDESSDSENTGLQIDVAEIDDFERPKKRLRIEIDDTSALNEMEEEIERQLDAKAAKTNLTATNVKNILRHVITNEHVMAMVQNRLQNTEDKIIFEPKLTRAKAKELAMKQPNMPWPMTPVKKIASSEVQELIEKELSEDSSDEEYNPDQDQQSDDETEVDTSTNSDVDSQPSTPANLEETRPTTEAQTLTEVQYDNDGIFKIPGIPHVPTEAESIGQRTRSKLSLSETPLEQIEQAFIPPDITIDMYDWDCDKDPDWDNFLKEFTQPLGHDAAIEDDPEADPEYNILEDKETDFLDKEELRMDKAVKVTKKELNDLVAELFEFFQDMFTKDQTESPKKRNTPDNSLVSMENVSTNNCMVDLLPALAESELPILVNAGQLNILAVQLRQHVQLMTQHFGMMYMHPKYHVHAKKCKENLNSLRYLTDGSNSTFNVENLEDGLDFVKKWETKFEDEDFAAEYEEFMKQEAKNDINLGNNGHKYNSKFHPELSKLFVECKAFMYPQLLPHTQFRPSLANSSRMPYLKSEDSLIALGLEQFTPYVDSKATKFPSKGMKLMDVTQLINKYMIPCRDVTALFRHIDVARKQQRPNPIKHYFTTGSAPNTIHCLPLSIELKAPKFQPRNLLPPLWRNFIEYEYKKRSWRRKVLPNKISALIEPSSNIIVDESLRNPVVNMLPSIPNSLNTSMVQNSSTSETHDESTAATNNDKTSGTSKSPQLRKTTPRLAKMKSAQNMKLMTQVSSSKGLSSCSRVKSRAKSESSKDSEESCGSTKGDNEDEIAELMLASTTIKKDSLNRKRAKEARELENIKRLLEAESYSAQEERAAKFAESYLQKLHVTLETSNPETLRAVFKLFLEYNEKMENLNKAEHDEDNNEDESSETTTEINQTKEKLRKTKDIFAVDFYKDVCNTLHDYPELQTDFLLFLTPHQAAMIDESTNHTMLRKMSEFMNVVQVYFAKQPSRLTKIMKAITQLASDRYVTMADVHAAMDPILRGHPVVMDLFLQVLPMGKPPESLFAMNLFENLTCPMGPYDKHKVYTEDSPELYENIELPLPTSQDDPYGGDNCKCECHDSSDPSLKTATIHCAACGTRFLNGRIYLQTSEGLRPAKVTFPGSDEEKLENIARVSLKTTERCVPGPSTTRRRKSSKNEPVLEESNQKQCALKASPTKDSDEGDRSTSKTKRGAKSPPKVGDQKKILKAGESSSSTVANSIGEPVSPLKSKRETRAERREAKLESKSTGAGETNKSSDETSAGTSELTDDSSGRTNRSNFDSSDSEANVTCENMDVSDNKSESDASVESKEPINTKPWTRNEDMILLQNIKKDYSESTFVAVSEMLGDRTVEQVEERCQVLLSLLEKMV